MALHNNEMNLVLSSDAKPRLKWTSELHQRFVDAVNQLGEATPKSLMRIMGIHGLTLYHLKSHLQKYRLGRSQLSQTYHQNKQEEFGENQSRRPESENCDGAQEHKHINESLQIAQALQMQMEVQRKLHEQIEVQRHLQLRIEAQGKYLQSVLKKAQETLSGYSSCSIEVEAARAQLSELVSMVDSGCPSSSFSVLTESEGSVLKEAREKLILSNRNSFESSLTSSESSGLKEEKLDRYTPDHEKGKSNSLELSLMEMRAPEKGGTENCRKRSRRTVEEVDEGTRFGLLKNIDLNCNTLNEFDSGPNVIDLNAI